MTNKTRPKPDHEIPAPLVPPVPMSQLQEEAALRRSEERIFAQLRAESSELSPRDSYEAASSPGKTTPHRPARGQFAWSFGIGFAVVAVIWAAIFVLPRLRSKTTPEPKWIAQHVQTIHGSPQISTKGHGRTYELQASNDADARIEAPGRWKLKAHRTSRFRMTRRSSNNTRVLLERGGLQVRVNPEKTQTFVVLYRDAKVVVRGTVFAVDAFPKELRVEVQRGHVQVIYAKRQIDLRAGTGVRLDLSKHKIAAPHRLPPPGQRSPLKRSQWLLKHHPKRLLPFALELLHSPALPPLSRSRVLFSIKDAMQRTGDLKSAEQLLRAIAAKELAEPITEQALYDAGVLSYRRKRQRQSARTFRAFLRRFPQSKNIKMARWYLQQLVKSPPPQK